MMIQSQSIIYNDGTYTFEGVISWDDSISEPKPGVLVVHTFRGQGAFENEKAEALAKLGYVGFAIDMYGQGRRATEPEKAQALMDELNSDRPLLLQRILLAVETLRQHKQVDATKIAAIGFCFGGKCVLDLARSGTDVAGVASFHGVYDEPANSERIPMKASALILHGWEDPLATPVQTVALGQELTERQADWQILAFGHTGHAFTNPKANFRDRGMFFQEKSNRRAWSALRGFLEEIFVDN